MRKIKSDALFVLGIIFIINAILGRYFVLPGYFESLENGSAINGGIPSDVDIWRIARYLLWAYSFKLGIYFIIIATLIKANVSRVKLILFSLFGLFYISLAYVPIPKYSSLFFGLGGAIMTIAIVMLVNKLGRLRSESYHETAIGIDLKIIGYFFFSMATYNLCPLLGVKGFALEPEKMIAYGAQTDAISFANHILIELVLGWVFVFIELLKENFEN